MDRTGPGGFSGDCRASRSDQIRNTAVALPCVETGVGDPSGAGPRQAGFLSAYSSPAETLTGLVSQGSRDTPGVRR